MSTHPDSSTMLTPGLPVETVVPQRYFTWLRRWRWLSILFMGLLVAVVLNLVFGIRYRNYDLSLKPDLWLQALLQSAVALVGIRFINHKLDGSHPWNQNLKVRFALQASLNLVYVLLTMVVMQIFFALLRWVVLGHGFISLEDEIMVTVVFVSASFVMVLIDWGLFLLNSWRQSDAAMERYRKEGIEFQFEMLRNQVNPHFLFNNLNTISSLVHAKPDLAAEFIRQLSKVYRYLLEYQERELINLAEEMEFLDSYLYLVQMRFGNNVLVHKDVPAQYLNRQVIPVCMQMLVENALKHNVASKNKPLSINITVEEPYLIISNNVQPKSSTEFSSRLGLKNIARRYQFLSNLPVVVSPSDLIFEVKLPLIITNESSNRRR